MRRLTSWLLLTFAWLCVASVARADVTARTSVVPSAGAAARLGQQTVLGMRVEGRQVVAPVADDASRPGLLLLSGVHVGLAPILGASLGYGYARGAFPSEGPAAQEHNVAVGLSVGRRPSASQRFGVFSRTRVGLRILDLPDRGWHTELRPREEVTVTLRMRQWMQASLASELLLQPSHPATQLLQVRVGPVLHGAIALRSGQEGNLTTIAVVCRCTSGAVAHRLGASAWLDTDRRVGRDARHGRDRRDA